MGAARLMPAIFFGHGNPMNVVRHNTWTDAWALLGSEMPRPRAVLSISAHWYVRGTHVTAMEEPPTIHDFGGFPEELYRMAYPAPGDAALADSIRSLLSPISVGDDAIWGLDHGTWTVLRHVFPDADIPVVQLSIDRTQPAVFHYLVGKKLAPLRGEGVLIMGSGNLIHNLHAYAWGEHAQEPFDWAERFEKRIRELILASDDGRLVAYSTLGRDAELSAPTPEHFLPFLYVLALRRKGDHISFPIEGFDGGSVSMLAVQFSQA
jgi:4,5-DOPA dioxygenase extradiol